MAAYFERARYFSIETLNILEGSSRPQANPQDRLYSNAVPGAIHDSNERCDAPKCHPETRTAVQEDVMGWIRDGDGDEEPMRIMWITGPAGSGKTAIVGSVAETCDEEGLLAATFFFSSFSGSEGRRLKGGLVTTLVYQLTQLDGMESFEADVLSTIQRNPAIFDARLQKQVEILILKPLRNRQTSGALPVSAQVIIIDGLDEVEAHTSRQLPKEDARLRNEADQVEVLCALHHAARDPAFPFRILIASRPERVIRDFFAGGAGGAGCRKISLQEQYNAEADIRLFLDAKFAEIRRRYRLSLSWPDESTLNRLVATAVPRAGPGSYATQYTLENIIGDLSGEIRQPSNPFGNLKKIALRRCQMNAARVIYPEVDNDSHIKLPHGAKDVGNQYVFMTPKAQRQVQTATLGAMGELISEELGMDNILPWGRLLLPNKQHARSYFAEAKFTRLARRVSRMVKVEYQHTAHPDARPETVTQFGEAQFFFLTTQGKPKAMVSLFGPRIEHLHQESHGTIWACEYPKPTDRASLRLCDITEIVAVVSMQPFIERDDDDDLKGLNLWFVVEKSGLEDTDIFMTLEALNERLRDM